MRIPVSPTHVCVRREDGVSFGVDGEREELAGVQAQHCLSGLCGRQRQTQHARAAEGAARTP